MPNLKECITVIVAIGVLMGGSITASKIFATNKRVDGVAQDLREHKLTLRLHDLQKRVWSLDEEFGEGCERCAPKLKEEWFYHVQEIDDILRELYPERFKEREEGP